MDLTAVIFHELSQVSSPHARVLSLTIHRVHGKLLLVPQSLSFPPKESENRSSARM